MMKKIMMMLTIVIAGDLYAQQADFSLIPYRSGDKWGYATPDKKVVIKPAYNDANWFSEGYASVKVGNKYGYINKTGKLVIPAKYTVAKPFRKGYMPNKNKEGGDSVLFAGASIQADGYEICINTKGARMPQCPAINENSVPENRVPVETVISNKTYSLPNNNGLFDKITDDYHIAGNDETYYIAVKGDRYGVFNSKFETIVPFEYNSIKINRKTAMPYLQVNKGGMYGILMPDGKLSIAPEYSNLNIIESGSGKQYVIVQKGGKTYVKDILNTDIISTGYPAIAYDEAGGFVITGDSRLQGFYFTEDNAVIQPKYKEIRRLNNAPYLRIVTASGKAGYINRAGEEYFSE